MLDFSQIIGYSHRDFIFKISMNTKKLMQKDSQNLFHRFAQLEDPRRGQGRTHELSVILIIVTMAIMSGYLSQRAMGDFVSKHRKELIKIFKPKRDRLPSRQTIGRVFQVIDFDKFSIIFYEWSSEYVDIKKGDWISIDGKGINGTLTNTGTKLQKYTNLVSIFASKKKQVITAGKVNDKSNEIPLVQQLIKDLDLEGVVFTLDALHCQKKTTKTIIKSKNDYVIGVKGNQKKLYEQVKKTPKIVNL